MPSTATARVRELSRGGRRKNDSIDAATAASGGALQGDAVPVEAEGASAVLRMLDERCTNLTRQRTRTVNQLHAVMRELLPGGVSTDLTANQAADALRRLRPCSPVEHVRKEIARDLVADVCALDVRLKTNQQRIHDTVTESGSSLLDVVGVGPVVARLGCWAARAARHGSAPREPSRSTPAQHR